MIVIDIFFYILFAAEIFIVVVMEISIFELMFWNDWQYVGFFHYSLCFFQPMVDHVIFDLLPTYY